MVIVSIGFLIAMYPIKPELSALGSFLLMFMAFTTLSFLITTPESVCENLTSYVLKNEPTATGCGDDKVHGDQHKFVTPTVRAVFSPELGVPCEDFLWIAPVIMRTSPMAASCVRTPAITPRAPAHSTMPKKSVKPLFISMLLLRASRSEMSFQPLAKKTRPTIRRSRRRRHR